MSDTAFLISHSDLRKTVDFFVFQPDGSHEDWMARLRESGISPRTLIEIAANELEALGTPQTVECASRLRAGEMDQYVAGRLGLV